MSTETAIKVLIAEREYPMKVGTGELDQVKAAEQEIQQKLKELKANYKIKEKQDLLAMCLLQAVVEKNQDLESKSEAELHSKIEDLESFVSDYLKK